MITLVTGLVAGFLVGRLLWIAAGRTFDTPALLRSNYRQRTIPTAVGTLVVLATLAVEAGRALAASFGVGRPPPSAGVHPAVLVVVLGFGLLGLVDDLLGSDAEKGFRGHVRALVAGRVTTGALKLLGGAAVALVAVASSAGRGPGRLVADAALVALGANLGNLVDRAPGRAIKFASVGFVAVAVAALAGGTASTVVGVAVVVGGSLSLLAGDLAERFMLGDVGANVLGAVVGLGIVLACGPATRSAALIGAVLLNLAGEVVSFSRVIDAVPPLRAFDRLGRRR